MNKVYICPSSKVIELRVEGVVATSLPVSGDIEGDQQMSNQKDETWNSSFPWEEDC